MKNIDMKSFLSEKVKDLKPSPTLAISAKAKEMKAKGLDVISLSLGEPDFDTPEHIKQFAINAIKTGKTKYTPVVGTIELRKAICKKFKEENNIDYLPEEIIVSNGAKQIIFNAFMATLNPGDEVIIPAPYWVSYIDNIELFGGKAVVVETTQENHFKITAKQLEDAITPKTKWLLINSPSNPTGMIYSKEDLMSIAEILRKNPNILLMTDDIYEYLIYEGVKFHTMAEIAPDLKERITTINGASKGFSMTGWRIGFAGANKDLINAMNAIQSQSTTNPCSISQEAVKDALLAPKDFLKEFLTEYKIRRDFIVDFFNSINVPCLKPEGAFYVFPEIKKFLGLSYNGKKISSSEDFCTILLEELYVATIPGDFFGAKNNFRISFASSMEEIKEACNRIKNFLQRIK